MSGDFRLSLESFTGAHIANQLGNTNDFSGMTALSTSTRGSTIVPTAKYNLGDPNSVMLLDLSEEELEMKYNSSKAAEFNTKELQNTVGQSGRAKKKNRETYRQQTLDWKKKEGEKERLRMETEKKNKKSRFLFCC